ncbi:hypothetical protein [Mesobacillus selenatarsenatis]|uniref:hypothetical protein n=1 Tax=Mesobacillus selenatarsenatis TaxID=388741 RepID=UPI0012EB100D|nr:hypothetical protein [Mesobacillus selenatarsenatis]
MSNISGSVLQRVVIADSALLKTQGANTYFAVKVRQTNQNQKWFGSLNSHLNKRCIERTGAG